MNMICGWCPECLEKRPEVKLDYPCPDCRGSEARAERISVGFRCHHHIDRSWLKPPPKATRKAQSQRKPRPKKSQR